MSRILGVLMALALALALALGAAQPVAAAPKGKEVPSREQWVKDVRKAMKGSGVYLRERTAEAAEGETLAVNFDIDNSTISTYYDGKDATAMPRVLTFAELARRLGVDLVFNTGRINTQRKRTINQLRNAGYDVARLCMRKKGETIPAGKQRCRDRFQAKGLTLVANVGNKPTDFVGGGYERAFRLPDYDGALG